MRKTFSLVWYRCPLCEGKEFEIAYVNPGSLAKVSPRPLVWDVIISVCKRCGLVQSNPRPTPTSIAQIYHPSLAHVNTKNIKPTEPTGQALSVRAEQVSFIKNILPIEQNVKILDIGCNDGFVLAQLKKAGYDVLGVEPDLTQAMRAQNRGVPVITTFYQNALFTLKSFDLISAFHVLEHIHNPHEFLKKAHKELKPNGYICLEVPDLTNYNATKLDDYFNCQHLFYYTPTSLGTMLSKIGFEAVKWIKKDYNAIRVLARKVGRKKNLKLDESEVERAKEIINSYKLSRLHTLNQISKKIQRALTGLNGKSRVAIWGAGQHTYDILRLTPLNDFSDFVLVDSDTQKHLSGFLGRPVLPPKELCKLKPSLVIVSSYAFQRDIVAQLKDMGFKNEQILTLYNDVRTYDGM